MQLLGALMQNHAAPPPLCKPCPLTLGLNAMSLRIISTVKSPVNTMFSRSMT